MGCQVSSSSLHHLAPLNINTSLTDQEHPGQDRVTIDALSDDCLLCIFDHYNEGGMWPEWHTLVHICRRWRHLVFSCPSYLNLRHVCRSKTHLNATLDVWSALPILPIDIQARFGNCADSDEDDIQSSFENSACPDEDDIIGALEYREHIAGIYLWDITSAAQLKKCITSMQEPFPLLASLHLDAENAEIQFVITDAFLGGSAPRLHDVSLKGVRFPTLPSLLSSTSHLVDLRLQDFPVTDSGDWLISPEAMATCLSLLTRLKSLCIELQYDDLYPPSQPPPELVPTIFPALTYFTLEGPYDFLEGLIARIDAPQLDNVQIHFWGDPILDAPRLPQFIQRTEMSKFPLRLEVYFDEEGVFLELRSSIGPAQFSLSLPCTREITSQLELMKRICAPCPLLFSQVKCLQIHGFVLVQWGPRSAMSDPWLGFFQPFTAVDTLLPSSIVTPHIATALGSLTETRAAEVLPMLQTIIMGSQSDLFQATELLNPFIVARDQANCPVIVKVIDPD